MKKTPFLAAALVAAAAAFMPGSADAAPGYSTANVNMRSGPSTGYPSVAVIPANAAIEIHGCLDGLSWCDVNWGPNRGWVSAAYLQARYQNRRVVVREAAPRVGVPVVTFNFNRYWDSHYRGRQFYRERDRWQRWHTERRDPRWERDRRAPREERRGERRRDYR